MSVDPTSGNASSASGGGAEEGRSISDLLSAAGRRPLDAATVTGSLPVHPAPPTEPELPAAPKPSPAVENPVLAAQLAAAGASPAPSAAVGASPAAATGLPGDARDELNQNARDAADKALRAVTRKNGRNRRGGARRKGEGDDERENGGATKRRGLGRELRALAFFSAAANVLLLAMPLHMLAVYERVLASGSGATLLYITLITLAALVLLGIAEVVRNMIAQRMAASYATRTAEPLFRGLVSDRASDGDDAGAEGGEVNRGSLLRSFYALRSVLASRAVLAVLDLPFSVLFLALLFALDIQIGLITLVGIGLLVGLAWMERRLAARPAADATRANSEAVSFSQAFVARAPDVRAMGLFPHLLRHWGARMGRAITHADDASRLNSIFFGASRTIRQGLQVLIVAWGAWLVLAGDMSGGMIFAASLISGRAIAPVEQVIGAWDRLVQGARSYREIESFLDRCGEPETAVVPSATAGDIDVAKLGVEVTSGGRTVSVLEDISFSLPAGSCMAVVGPSGAGKSTLARCLSGAVVPTTGSVRLDDFELTHWPDLRRRQSIGYVPQDGSLLPGTVADNVCGFSPAPDDDAIVAAARTADIHSQIVRLPDGYSTVIGQDGRELSAGQRPQVALARAFYAKPRLLVLDEPNAHLDQKAEDALLRTIARLKDEGVCIVVVSQRRSVLKVADCVLTLNEGRMVSLAENRGQWRARRDDARPAGAGAAGKAQVRVDELPSTRGAEGTAGGAA